MISFSRARDLGAGKENGEIKRGSAEGEKKRGENHGGGSLTSQQVFEALPIPLLLCTDAFISEWADWVEYRLECGRIYRWPTTIRCFRKTLIQCEQWGPQRSINAIDYSIRMGYRGLFEPRSFPSQKFPKEHKIGSCL